MINDDTIKLLRECNSGIKMGIYTLNEVHDKTKDSALREILTQSACKHAELENDTHAILAEYGDEDKEPPAMAKGMSWFKTNVKLTLEESDSVIADLITDGCNMGIKSLHRYLNQYPAAEKRVRDLADRLISLEEKLRSDLCAYL